ncbi:MAG TPA: hypothetical protein VFJ76_07650 [Solirubrobacterales bacterium]|nr:hypothetical protein [Solirubrobacterales bacterium]
MNSDQIRKELSGLAQVRAGLEAELEQVRDDSAALLSQAHGKIPMKEAAELLGLSRFSAYELLKRQPRTKRGS